MKSAMHKDKLTPGENVPNTPDSNICCTVCGKTFHFLGNHWHHLPRYDGMEVFTPPKITAELNVIHNSKNTSDHCGSYNWTFFIKAELAISHAISA